jgi:hypothetical protein
MFNPETLYGGLSRLSFGLGFAFGLGAGRRGRRGPDRVFAYSRRLERCNTSLGRSSSRAALPPHGPRTRAGEVPARTARATRGLRRRPDAARGGRVDLTENTG